MAVKGKSKRSKDRSNGRTVDVHYVTVTKSNRKGAAEHFGGTLEELKDGWHIILRTTVGKRERIYSVIQGDIVFCTGMNTRWQVLQRVEFKKRFPDIKL